MTPFKKILAAAMALAIAPTVSVAESEQDNKSIVIKAMTETLVNANIEAVDKYFLPTYIQHNPDVPSGTDAFKGLVGMLTENGGLEADFVRAIGDGDFVAVHARYVGFGPKPIIGFDVFRLENGKIAEHWDNLIPEAAPNPSGHTQIDGATEITDLDKTEANKAKVEEFITRSMIKHEKVNITNYISPVTYVQHNPEVADGLEGFGAFMKEMGEKGISMNYNKLHKVIGEGNFVLTMSEGSFGEDAMAFYDLFRLEDGLIVEHWDVIAPMPGPDAKHNETGKF